MEVQRREGVQLTSTNTAKPSTTLTLRNFTIPRKKRVSGQVLLEPCPGESRDYSLIQSKLREARLDLRKEHANDWLWNDIKLVHNEEFLKEFSDKRSAMRTKGRHGREMEERFCFLVASRETTTQIYQHGLRTDTQEHYSLGKSSHGVYLFRHVDVALKHAATRTLSGKNLIVFKVLFGKVKKVAPSVEWNRTPDPMVAFDCHMSRDAVSYRESLSQQVLGSSVFLFDYNERQELNKRPRQCLPYAVVSFVQANSATAPTSISPPASPVNHPTSLTHGPLRGCTVAERRGKGENATVTFKHFATQGCPGSDYTSQTYGTDTAPVQPNELQPLPIFTPPQLYMPLFHTAGYFTPSLPYVDSIPFPNTNPDDFAFTSNAQVLDTTAIHGSNTDKCDVIPPTSAERISTIVYSSRLVKDPRLSRQEMTVKTNSSEPEKSSNGSECDEVRCQQHLQNQEEKNESFRTVSCETQSLEMAEKMSKDCCLKPTQGDPQEHHSNLRPKAENMPSIKLFKMKFQKYAAYLRMSEEERRNNIWSQVGLTPEQKQLLIDRIHFYDTYYHKYKQGVLFQKESDTKNSLRSSHRKPENDKTCQSTMDKSPLITQDTVNHSHITHLVYSNVSNLRSTADLEDSETAKVDTSNADNNEVTQNDITLSDQTGKTLKEKEQNPSTDSHEYSAEPRNESVVPSVREPDISEIFSDSLMLNNSEKKEVIECAADFKQHLSFRCPSEQGEVNLQVVNEIKCDSALNISMEENQELKFHKITTMDVADCVEIVDAPSCSVVDATERNLPSSTAMGADQDSLSSTKNKDRESLIHSKSGDSPEISIELKREELRQENTIHAALYRRLQLDHLLPKSNGTNTFSNKSYLCPKNLKKIPCVNLNKRGSKKDYSKAELQNWECGEGLQLSVISRSHQVSATTEGLTLSERFSKLRSLQKMQTVIGHKKKVTSNNTDPHTGDVMSNPEGVGLSNDGEKRWGNNVKLVQLLTQRFNASRSLVSCRHPSRKCSKMQRRRKTNSSTLSLKHSAQPTAHVLKRNLLFRKKCLWKTIKKWKTKQDSNKTSQCQVMCSKSVSNPSSCQPTNPGTAQSYKGPNSCLNLSSASQSSGPQTNNNHEFNQGEVTNISTEDHSCLSISNNPGHDDEFSHITEQYSEVVCEVVLRTSSNEDAKKSQGEVPLEDRNPDEMGPERGKKDRRICNQKKASPVTCSGNNESNKKEEATAQIKRLQASTEQEKDKYDTGELYKNNNDGDNEEKSIRVQAVSSISDDVTSGNMTISSTAEAQVAMTTDLPRLINSDVEDTSKETRNPNDKVGRSVSRSVVDIMANASGAAKTVDMEANISIQNSDLFNLANSIDANTDKLFLRAAISDVDQISLKMLPSANDDFISSNKNTSDLSEATSNSHCHHSAETSDRATDSGMETTGDLLNKDAEESGIVVMPGNLQSAWQGQDKNNATNTETMLISKLRDYLNKFEFTVKRHETMNDSVKEGQVPMAWITLDSTVHKQQLIDTRHYNTLHLVNLRNQGSDFVPNQKDHTLNYVLPSMRNEEKANVQNSSVTPTKRKTNKNYNHSKGFTSKRTRSKLARVSPDSTSMLETVQKDSQTHLMSNMDTDQLQISTSMPNLQPWMQNQENTLQQNQTVPSQGSENLNGSDAYQPTEKATEVNERTLYDKKMKNIHVQNKYSVTDISTTLKLADHAVSVTELITLQLKCQPMLHHFISNFERDQNISFYQSCISRSLVLENYLDHPPAPVELKYEGLNSFLELQMMVEAFQFIENKINFLSQKATFRSLLWYDPSLYGELYKGAVGFQQQSSLFSSFQQCIASEGYNKLQEYYIAVSTLHQQLQDAPETSYYMYLKSKRERLEIEAALRNHLDIKSFFLSVPVALMINFGDSLENLEKAHRIVMTFVETPSDRLPGTFDVGKAEHLSIICRYLQEKVVFIKSTDQISRVSWFGLEHLLYDASKLLVWRESEQGMPNEVLLKYKRSNPQIVYGVTESGVALVNKMEQPTQPVERAQITPQQQVDGVRNYRNIQSSERIHGALDIQTKAGMKEIHQPTRRRVTHPPLRSNLNDGGVTPLIQPSWPAQLVRPTPYTDFPQQSSAVHWRMAGNHAWGWNPLSVVQPSKAHSEIRTLLLSRRRATIPASEPRPDIQNNHAVRKQPWPPSLLMNSRAVERNIHHNGLQIEQTNEANAPVLQPFPFTSPDMSSGVPSPVSFVPISNTLNQVPSHEILTPLNYPYFVFNGQTYSTVAPSVPVPVPASALHAETRYHPV